MFGDGLTLLVLGGFGRFVSSLFMTRLLAQTLIVHMIRTQHIPFIQSRAAMPIFLLTACIMAFGIYLPFSSLGAHLGMVPLPWCYFGWLAGILLSYCVLTQLVKAVYIRRFGQWL
jgi:Mg2+-importing ATPase